MAHEKLNCCSRNFNGFNTNSLKWFQSYLSGRYQNVCVDSKLSEPLGIHSGVPQGSILGPAHSIFLLFINDLPLALKNNIGIYADDSTLYASASNLAEVEEKIRPDTDAVSMWAKTKYSIISTTQKIANSAKQSLDLSVDGMQLTKVESERVLGVYIDHLTISPGTNTLTHCAENYFKELQFYQELGNIYQRNTDCFSTMQVSNRSLLIAVLFGATVAKPT